MADGQAEEQFLVEWHDAGVEPSCPPNPAYPDGVDVVLPTTLEHTCKVVLPYPAKGCGAYVIRCKICSCGAVISTAGRADDPRSVTLPCREIGPPQ